MNIMPAINPIANIAAIVHHGLPLSSGFGSCAGLSEANRGLTVSENAISTLSGLTLGLAALATSSFNCCKDVPAGSEP